MISAFILWCVSFVSVCCDRGDKFRISIPERVEVVTSVKNYFRSGCIFFVESWDRDSRGTVNRHMLIRTRKLLSIQEVPTATLSVQDNRAGLQCNKNRPLLVLISVESTGSTRIIRQFLEGTYMSDFFWLLFLERETSRQEFFTGIDIPFDCEFLVAQPEDDHSFVLTEVYRVGPNLPLQTYRFGNWTPGGRLTWPSQGFYQRRNNLQGLVLKAGFKQEEWTPVTILGCTRDTVPCFLMFIWMNLEKELNFTSQYYLPEDKQYGSRGDNGSWSGVIGMLQRHEVEVSNSPTTITPDRTMVMDFTVPLYNSRYGLIIRQPDAFDLKWNSFFMPFSLRLWITVIFVIVLLSICLTATYHLKRHYGMKEAEDFSAVSATFLTIGAFFQQGDSISTKSSAIRLLFLTSYLTAVILFASYSAAFISYLTLRTPILPFKDFEGFIKDGSYRFGVMKNSAEMDFFRNARMEVLKRIYDDFVVPDPSSLTATILDGLKNACTKKKYTYFVTLIALKYAKDKMNCILVPVEEAFIPTTTSFGTVKRSPYRRLFNHRLQQMRREGLLDFRPFLSTGIPASTETSAVSMDMGDAVPILCILAAGVAVSALLLAAELCNNKTLGNKKKTHTDILILGDI